MVSKLTRASFPGGLLRAAIALVCLALSTLQAASVKLELDPSQSYIVAVTRKSGVFSFAAGHDHGILATAWSADVCFDRENPAASRVSITVPTASLRIDSAEARRKAGIKPEGPSPKDIQEIQQKMLGPANLGAESHPEIRFQTTSVTSKGPDSLVLTGPLTIRGITRPASAAVKFDSSYSFSGEFRIKQSDFGIKPASVGGVVNVKDPVEIRFRFSARATAATCNN